MLALHQMVSLLVPSMNPSILCKLQDSTNTLTPYKWLASNFSLQYHLWIKCRGHENNRNYHQFKELIIFKQTLLVITVENVERSVWSVWILMLHQLISWSPWIQEQYILNILSWDKCKIFTFTSLSASGQVNMQ